MTTLLSVNNLSFEYGKEKVLDDVSFSLNEGDYAIFIGENGAGKSTFLKILLGMLKGTGEINFPEENHNIGYVPQIGVEYKADFPITCFELVSLALYPELKGLKILNSEQKKRVKDALFTVQMEEYRDKLFFDLSGGQRQRVLIAKALVSKPKLLILDEPTNGLDDKMKSQLYELLSHLNKFHGITILLVTHDINYAKNFEGRVFEIKDGKIREV